MSSSTSSSSSSPPAPFFPSAADANRAAAAGILRRQRQQREQLLPGCRKGPRRSSWRSQRQRQRQRLPHPRRLDLIKRRRPQQRPRRRGGRRHRRGRGRGRLLVRPPQHARAGHARRPRPLRVRRGRPAAQGPPQGAGRADRLYAVDARDALGRRGHGEAGPVGRAAQGGPGEIEAAEADPGDRGVLHAPGLDR